MLAESTQYIKAIQQACKNHLNIEVSANITMHLISYSLRLPLSGDCGRLHL